MYSLESSLPSNEDENAASHVILPAFPSFCGCIAKGDQYKRGTKEWEMACQGKHITNRK